MTANNPTQPPSDSQLNNLAHLHRMSRTAGAGTSEYAAVNPAAVVAIILGIASLLALFNSVFIIIPVAALVASIIAITQIRGSNGTQTGLLLGVLGLLLAIGCMGFKTMDEFRKHRAEAADEADAEKLVAQLESKAKAGEYESIFDDLFDPRLKERITLTDLKGPLEMMNKSPHTGGIKRIRTNGLYRHFNGEEGKQALLTTLMVEFEKLPNISRYDLFLQGTPGNWKVTNIPDWFPAKKAPTNPQQAPIDTPLEGPTFGPTLPTTAPAKP